MRDVIAEEQRTLKKDEARGPHGGRAAEQRQDALPGDRLGEEEQRATEEDRERKNGPGELPGPCFSRSPWHVDGNVSTGQGLTPVLDDGRGAMGDGRLLNRAALLRLRDPVGHPLWRRRALEVVIEEL